MNRLLFGLLLFAVFVCAVANNATERALKFNTWAILVSGSSGWSNYRHQADVCHAYQVLHNLGVPEEHIIVMMEDDIAYHSNNQRPGKIFNKASYGGEDVYEGVPHDYTHDLVTRDNFLKIMKGEEMTVGSKKTLRSGPDDNVFIFYDDHGNTDVLAFPHGSSLRSANIQDALDTMVQKKMFKNLVFYVEACYSGSLFYKLNLPEHVYVTTAAPVGASSWSGCGGFCDAYAYAWISDLEKSHAADYSFNEQFSGPIQTAVKSLSQGCQYGDTSVLGSSPIFDFFAPNPTVAKKSTFSSPDSEELDLIPTLDVELVLAQREYDQAPSAETKKELDKQIAIRQAVDDFGISVVAAAVPGVNYLASTPCTDCSSSSSCRCYTACTGDGKSATYCQYQCCSEASCYNDPVSRDPEFYRRENCAENLSYELTETCGIQHPYLLSLEYQFRRICKQPDADIAAAVEAIRSYCATFNVTKF